jgi:hypothetical protein
LFQSYVLIVIFAIFLTWFVTSASMYFTGEHALFGYRSKTQAISKIQSSLNTYSKRNKWTRQSILIF